jgi:hypothetical protein
MGYGLNGWSSIPDRGKIFLFSLASKTVLELTLSDGYRGIFPFTYT